MVTYELLACLIDPVEHVYGSWVGIGLAYLSGLHCSHVNEFRGIVNKIYARDRDFCSANINRERVHDSMVCAMLICHGAGKPLLHQRNVAF